WYVCPNTLLNEETSEDFTATALGSYKVEITVDGCSIFSECIEVTSLSTTNLKKNVDFSMYPNPGHTLININSSEIGQFSILNMLGQTVKTFYITVPNENYGLNIEDLNEGMYLVK